MKDEGNLEITLEEIKKPTPRFYAFPADHPLAEFKFYLEIIVEEHKIMGEMLNVWLCKEDIGIKEYLVGLPFKQNNAEIKEYSYDELMEIVRYTVADNIEGFLEEYNPEDLDRYYDVIFESDQDLSPGREVYDQMLQKHKAFEAFFVPQSGDNDKNI